MRSFLIVLIFILLATSIQAQEKYIVDGQTYELKTELKGPLTLLWNTIEGRYRYFLERGNTVLELKNTKENGQYQEEYKTVLKQQTADAEISAEKVKLTLPSLHDFVARYNKMKDPNFEDTNKNIALHFRLGGFVGITNSIYTANPEDISQAFVGVELEMLDLVKLKRHALVLDFQHTFESSDYKYSASQLALNYRFKFVKTPKLDIYLNAKFAALTFYSMQISFMEETTLQTRNDSGSDFNAPLTFGIGADYKVGDGYITFRYQDIVGINVDSNKEFPINFSLGYKFNL
ncbi:hypothetical protein EI546_13225 [Aequorivita sp. H23M31]|uniref:Outer membrane protein beta-barrel domain-containing protein n=1 Tax=Aequorivita ciconiae TaxID=2494375 RepID=A0A410G5V1_9FLAO|nr:porin family protein [Aequorivita sp. H23M31]QAA82620.1 hypothetical protein EI546_13225 [Aequorivita sp. H23M31]